MGRPHCALAPPVRQASVASRLPALLPLGLGLPDPKAICAPLLYPGLRCTEVSRPKVEGYDSGPLASARRGRPRKDRAGRSGSRAVDGRVARGARNGAWPCLPRSATRRWTPIRDDATLVEISPDLLVELPHRAGA